MVEIADTAVFTEYESNVRTYCRHFPAVFQSARGACLYSESGETYIDFLAGAGALNYGHNNDYIKGQVLAYLSADGVTHALDMHTTAKRAFLETFTQRVLQPRQLEYKVQFCGPTGTNAVEAALKLARKITGRPGVFSFMGAYHGVSAGSLAATGSLANRAAAGVPLSHVSFMPFPHGDVSADMSLGFIERALSDPLSGIERPAAIILETIQAEGGVIVAPAAWLRGLRQLCDAYDILLICDEIQVGCGRTGSFFSFEAAGIVPDLITLSKSISGYGFPMALLLMRPQLDAWAPGEHTGTFRGNQVSFVGARAALEYYEQADIEGQVRCKAAQIERALADEIVTLDPRVRVRGRGMIWGVDLAELAPPARNLAAAVARGCYTRGLIVETVGRHDTTLKIIPPLTIEPELLGQGLTIMASALAEALAG